MDEEKAKLAVLASFERTQTSVLPEERRQSIAAQSTESPSKSSPSQSRETSKDLNTPLAVSPTTGKLPELVIYGDQVYTNEFLILPYYRSFTISARRN